ncbi:hypothetical protein WJ0W_000109 [Paenibacillus melissococcoides]|uniref:Uncharacterized protein n=1 Tax=Paenibacillus melissococcoides TaxID=2912268 RepID=A0ABN8U0X4_9BACL|nr:MULTISPECIES: hypothetical protein [Paenibacillus]MEB9895862.1 hypothetical protein [Bacillus cereus]CAH8242900.1 hypothetical protein WJ0W_000109 [Paenibacillus melissococcoides]CAH8703357.1 hypothetical protein WDD9_000106 [Paenibacillus melissococcoides]CAH8706195.1 hypothetical protein HTL2_001190 [Paenibacillus melissococcoides]GIO82445.1 hypothetical protein J6TS7_60550 [Paenibacillus dendritiformis]
MMKKQSGAIMATLLLALACLLAGPAALHAASAELSATAKAAFDKMVAAADRSQADKLTQLYQELSQFETAEREWQEKTKRLHYDNAEALAGIRQQLKRLHEEKLKRLDSQVQEAKKKYQPLFDAYSALNKQISAAKIWKNKQLNAALRLQHTGMKPLVQTAREDIRRRQAALKSARQARTDAAKRVRQTLSAIDTVKVQIKKAKSAASTCKSRLSATRSTLTQAARKGDANASLKALISMTASSRQRNERTRQVFQLEQKIGDIIQKARTQLQSYSAS